MSKRTASPVRSGDVVEVTVDRLAQGGRGVARHEGFVLFVGRALPGDTVRARVTRVKRSFAEAVVDELVSPGPRTVDPQCDPKGECGACTWQRMPYDMQLEVKQDMVRDAIVRLGGVDDPPMDGIVGADDPTHYRNKVEYTFAQDAETGEVTSGYHKFGAWDQIVAVDQCLIADERGTPAKRTIDAWANRHGLAVYDRESGAGLLRSMVIRVGHASGEVQVHLVTGPTKKGLPRAAELVDDLEAEVPGLVGVLHSESDSPAEVSFGAEPPKLLWGRDWFEETLGGHVLRVRSQSFLQTNTAMADRLYERVLDVAQPRPDDVAYDLYCGLGSITLALAPHVQEVVGVEVVPEAIECAKENAELNGIDNVEWQVGNVRPILKFAKGVWPNPSLIVVDPPRAGLVPKVVRRICEAGPERIVYVSCNPTTFAGNLPMFREHGYELVYAQPVDQFPFTPHCELVARFEPIPGFVPPAEEDVVYGRSKDSRRRARQAEDVAASDQPGEADGSPE
jgi:23S rRNA (uracil1939-C5)-methyltransferase